MTEILTLQVVFEVVRGSDIHGDIAIDDISFTRGNCPRPGWFIL